MNGTPRVHGAFPITPQTQGLRQRFNPNYTSPTRNSKLPQAPRLQPIPQEQDVGPIISADLVSPAQQRFAVLLVYCGLWFWRLWDLYRLIEEDDSESLWQFLKWLFIDSAFLFGVPALRIPWLEWSSGATTLLFVGHAVLNGLLMFRVTSPFLVFFQALVKFFWDKEQGLSDRKVETSRLLDTAPFLSGRQVIQLLPEGSVHLNPNHEQYCLGETRKQIDIPIQINQTEPILIELLRLDLESDQNETITIKASEAKKLRSVALKMHRNHDMHTPLMLHHPIKKTGKYKIVRVTDQSGLAVRPRNTDFTVPHCPRASVKDVDTDRCTGDRSKVVFVVEGVPPLSLKYKASHNSRNKDIVLQSIQPEGLAPPYMGGEGSESAMVKREFSLVAATRMYKTEVPVDEDLSAPGTVAYSIESVEDAFGNVVKYEEQIDEDGNKKGKKAGTYQNLKVHGRPRASMKNSRQGGCDMQNPLKFAIGEQVPLPLELTTPGQGQDSIYTVELQFTPEDEMSNFNYQPKVRQLTFKNGAAKTPVSESGLYALRSVKTQYCEGEVAEPTSCLLQHAEQPSVLFNRREITDQCEKRPVGMILDLDFLGTPPFTLTYLEEKEGQGGSRQGRVQTHERRYSLTLKPESAGRYKYSFTHLSDHHYQNLGQSEEFSQEVKPSASAKFEKNGAPSRLCKDEAVEVRVAFTGEPPFTLEYALVHGTKPKTEVVTDIMEQFYTIKTPALSGGDYLLQLLQVQDVRGCKERLKDEFKFSVRHQRPKASFGLIDGKKSMLIPEGQQRSLPVRLSGEGPWTITLQNLDDKSSGSIRHVARDANSHIEVKNPGRYELQSVHDATCPGDVDETAKELTLSWIQRPSMRLSETAAVTESGGSYRKEDICEGDGDDIELAFSGTPPFTIKYEMTGKPETGPKLLQRKELPGVLGIASIQLETEKAGTYEYKFHHLSDLHYRDNKNINPIIVTQKVNSRPSAKFKTPGKTYNYCTAEGSGGEDIPVQFSGHPPFAVELEIKHSGSTKPETLRLSGLQSHNEVISIPKRHLVEGHSSLSIKRVKDSRGCQSKSSVLASASGQSSTPRVQISVHEPPRLEPVEATKEDYCVGERVSFRLTGAPPFNIFYTWHGKERKASSGTTFQRIADEPGVFAISAITDSGSDCKSTVTGIRKTIHPIPEAKIAQGKDRYTDIHEGGSAPLVFELKGTPPFLFTYTRAELLGPQGKKGKHSTGRVLETKTVETDEFRFEVEASEEGVYEVISVKDRYCGASRSGIQSGKKGQKLLQQG